MIEQLTKFDIDGMFSKTVYERGIRYYREGRVKDLYHDPTNYLWSAKVKGSKTYHVTIDYDETGISTECTCPAYDQYWEPCKHIAAVFFKIFETTERMSPQAYSDQSYFDSKQKQLEELQRMQQKREREQAERQAIYIKQLTNEFIETIASRPKERIKINTAATKSFLTVEWIIKLDEPYYNSSTFFTIEMKVGEKRTYVVKKIKDFLKAIKKQVPYSFTKSFSYDPTNQVFTLEDEEILNLLQTAMTYEESYHQFHTSSFYSRSSYSNERVLLIPPLIADELLMKLTGDNVRFEINDQSYSEININESELPFSIYLDKGKQDDFQLNLTELLKFDYLDLYGYFVSNNNFYKASDEQQMLISELQKLILQASSPLLPIANEQIETFLSQVAPRIGKIGKIKVHEDVANKIIKFPLNAKLFIDFHDEQLNVSLEFYYGEEKVQLFDKTQLKNDGPILVRDLDKEQEIIDVIESSSLQFNGKFHYLEGDNEIYEFLYEVLPLLENKLEVFLTSAVKSLILPARLAPKTNIEVDSSGNWLEVNFNMDGIEQQTIKNILQSVVEKKKFFRLPSGAFVSLETEEFQTVGTMLQEFNIKKTQLQKGPIQLPIYRGMQIDEIVSKEKGSSTKFGKQFRKLLSQLKHPDELEFELPNQLLANLRDYQNYGFQWFKTLSSYRLGGILADDMGLGKTLQSIAFILSEKGETKNGNPALIVAPASLVYNWKNEFQKFAPSLRTEVMLGKPQERIEKLQNDEMPDVWITSYPTLRQDIDSYQGLQFTTLILDEAQAIKNYTTKAAKAVREIQANTRFALSGTPIENSIDELWSIFQAVLPDFFPNQKNFRQLDTQKVAKMIRPFLLRRVKKDVLKELPDKIETVHYSELTNEQKGLYLAYLEKIQKESKESLEGEGFQKSRMKILAGLTRLRQLCCHPSLFLDHYEGQSGKLTQLLEIITQAKENKKRMLIFSQFTSMLAIIRNQLEIMNEQFFYLDGQTNPKARVEMVEKFNQGDADIFLISLKAGNTGLNLTGADTVILYDLWWNPAVEEQAAGRAHRIGQKNVVQVIRLITQGTIEEKIYELQQNKKELIETVVEPGDQATTSITEQEIREILNI